MQKKSFLAVRPNSLLASVVVMAALVGWSVASIAVDDPVPAKAFPFKQIGPGVFMLGKVTLDKGRKTISFPVRVNQTEGVVEYAVVTSIGKTHESAFRTEAEPEHVHMALLLLGAKGGGTNVFSTHPETVPPGENVRIEVRWKLEGRDTQRPLEDFIVTTNNQKSLGRGPWTYNGSYFFAGRFMAQGEGSLISIHSDPAALINNPREGRENDDLNHINKAAMPPPEQALEVLIRLQEENSIGKLPP